MAQTRMTLGEYQAWITVEGSEVEHYDLEVNEEAKTVTCWIASTVGKRFVIHGSKTHTKFDCGYYAYVDGAQVGGRCIPKHIVNLATAHEGIVTGPQTIRPFLFASLQVTDDDALLTAPADSIGEIKICVRRVDNVENVVEATPVYVPECGKVHERRKKAMAHRVQYGGAESKVLPKCADVIVYEVLATFIVRYRSIDLLKANGIVPRDVTPHTPGTQDVTLHPTTADRSGKRKLPEVKEEEISANEDVIDMDSDDDEERQKEAELEAELKRIRDARLARKQDKPPTKKVKSESKPVFLPGEVIDLTI